MSKKMKSQMDFCGPTQSAERGGLPSDQRQEVSHLSHYTFTVLLSRTVLFLTQTTRIFKVYLNSLKIMRYICWRVFGKCGRQVHWRGRRAVCSLQVIKTHSRMLHHHHHHVPDPLYCIGEQEHKFSSIARITKSLHLLLHLA